jgi:sugar diacid utilization regulator
MFTGQDSPFHEEVGGMGEATRTDTLDGTVEWLDGGLELALVTGRATRPSQVYEVLASVACELCGSGSSAVLMLDSQRFLRVRGWSGAGKRLIRLVNDRRPILVSDGQIVAPSVRALRSNTPIWVPDVQKDRGCAPWAAALTAEGVHSVLAVPIRTDERCLGVLELYPSAGEEPAELKVVLLERLGRVGAVAIDVVVRRLESERLLLAQQESNRKLLLQVEWRKREQMTEAQLMEVFFEAKSLDALARVLATSLECTSVVEEVGVLNPHTAVAGTELLPDAAGALESGQIGMRGRRPDPAGRPLLISSDPATGMPSGLAAPSLLAGDLTGWVSAYRLHPFDSFERRVVTRAALVMAALAQRQRAEREVEWRLSREFFDQLLEVKAGADITAVVERGLNLGVDLRQPNAMLIFNIAHDPSDRSGGPDDVNARTTRLIASVQRAVDISGSGGVAIARADHVVVLYPALLEGEVNELIARLQDEMRAVRILERLTIVVSTVSRQPSDYEPNYRAALTALSLKKVGSDCHGVVRVPDLGVYTLLLNARRPDELAAFAVQTMAKLRDYDEDNGTDLLDTLKVYLEERGKLAATAARLFVHANTVSYRLGRIRDITGGHPGDLDFALRFELAFMIERLMGVAST